jgi:alkaline phosphatase D
MRRYYFCPPLPLALAVVFQALSLIPSCEMAQAAGAALAVGPITGAVTATQASVFLRTSDADSVVVQYSTDPGMANPASSAATETSSADDFTAIVTVSPLQPLTTYYLNILIGGIAQLSAPYPSFTTFPAPGSSVNFKFIYLTDFANLLNGASGVAITPAFQNASAENPAFAFIGGDYDHRGAIGLSGHRIMYQQLYNPTSIGMGSYVSDILGKMPIVHQWDDHDSGPDNVDRTYSLWNESYTAYTEYFPRYNSPAAPPAIWQSFSYAQVDFFVLDCRSQRDNEYDRDGVQKSMLDGNHLGSSGQVAWLEKGLLTSRAKWKVIFSSIPVNPTTKFPDSWAGYQTEWTAIRLFIQSNHIKGAVIISGDLHSGGIDNGTASGVAEMVVPNVNIITPAATSCSTGVVGTWSQGTYNNEAGSCRGYGVVSVATNPDQLTLQVKDENGNAKLTYTMTSN